MADDDDHHEQSMVTNGVGEVVPLRGFWQPHKPVYVPGFGPEDPPQVSMSPRNSACASGQHSSFLMLLC